ncbi:hypothetical protein [Ramlibacter sp.]|uniref:hypothetical protein n=1 Tax=Ramlibacter sp. TaxID=1917967 RepID=UPI002637AD4F|nr:hypothetical protein [Ramlibacter sp.]
MRFAPAFWLAGRLSLLAGFMLSATLVVPPTALRRTSPHPPARAGRPAVVSLLVALALYLLRRCGATCR